MSHNLFKFCLVGACSRARSHKLGRTVGANLSFRKAFLAVFVLLVSMTASQLVYAQNDEVSVNVRLIKASQRSSDRELRQLADFRRSVDPRISDLADQLIKLPFRSYSLVLTDSKSLLIKRKAQVALGQGQMLTIRPLYFDKGNNRVGLWLRWQEQDGEDILDTRLHLDIAHSVLAGTDSTSDSGLILAVSVDASITVEK